MTTSKHDNTQARGSARDLGGGDDDERASALSRVQCLVILHICPTFGNYLYNPHFTPPFFIVTLFSMVTPNKDKK